MLRLAAKRTFLPLFLFWSLTGLAALDGAKCSAQIIDSEPDPFASFQLDIQRPTYADHIVEFSIAASKPIRVLHADFYDNYGYLTPESSILIDPSAAVAGTFSITPFYLASSLLTLTLDLEFAAPPMGTFSAARLFTISADGSNWGYGAVATGFYADGSPFRFSAGSQAIPEPATAGLAIAAVFALIIARVTRADQAR